MNKKEQRRLMVLNKLDKREIISEEAAQLLCLGAIYGTLHAAVTQS